MSVYSMPFFNPFGSVNPFDFFRQGGQTATRNAERVTELTQRITAASQA
jgi:hypothetical protein